MKSDNLEGLNGFDDSSKYLELLPSALQKELKQLEVFLGQKRGPYCRRTQSIVTRSEVELFGISSPRFATRIYFDDGGFANCRRLEHLIRNIPRDQKNSYGERYTENTIDRENRNPELKEIQYALNIQMPESGCIADCLLSLPSRLVKNHFRCIQVDEVKLFKTYTEKGILNNDKPFTPYVKSIQLGGGQCAQAACFIATMSLSNFAKSFCGIAEITAYAHTDKCFELSLSGLTPPKMKRYFSRVGLRMSRQTMFSDVREMLTIEEKSSLAKILRCYLQSNMPIIFPVDSYKMAQPIYLKNGHTPDRPVRENSHHVVVLVGYHRANDYFVFHDPGVYPYMTANILDLANVGCKREVESIEIADNGVFMPVTPAQVKLPLAYEGKQDSDRDSIERMIGLIEISETLHLMYESEIPSQKPVDGQSIPFILGQNLQEFNIFGINIALQKELCNAVRTLLNEIKERRKFLNNKWFWFEICTDGILIWDAESNPMRDLPEVVEGFNGYILGMVKYNGAGEFQLTDFR